VPEENLPITITLQFSNNTFNGFLDIAYVFRVCGDGDGHEDVDAFFEN
jgi:hypothetical protein